MPNRQAVPASCSCFVGLYALAYSWLGVCNMGFLSAQSLNFYANSASFQHPHSSNPCWVSATVNGLFHQPLTFQHTLLGSWASHATAFPALSCCPLAYPTRPFQALPPSCLASHLIGALGRPMPPPCLLLLVLLFHGSVVPASAKSVKWQNRCERCPHCGPHPACLQLCTL